MTKQASSNNEATLNLLQVSGDYEGSSNKALLSLIEKEYP